MQRPSSGNELSEVKKKEEAAVTEAKTGRCGQRFKRIFEPRQGFLLLFGKKENH